MNLEMNEVIEWNIDNSEVIRFLRDIVTIFKLKFSKTSVNDV